MLHREDEAGVRFVIAPGSEVKSATFWVMEAAEATCGKTTRPAVLRTMTNALRILELPGED